MIKQIDIDEQKQQYAQFIRQCKTLALSTVDETGDPFISYAPFVEHNGKLYIYISKITEHFKYLESNGFVHAMMIADEQDSRNLFARQRARFPCAAKNVGNEDHEDIFAKFNDNHGESMMQMLRGLDLSLFELTPQLGRYVIGFGQAYNVDLLGSQFQHVILAHK